MAHVHAVGARRQVGSLVAEFARARFIDLDLEFPGCGLDPFPRRVAFVVGDVLDLVESRTLIAHMSGIFESIHSLALGRQIPLCPCRCVRPLPVGAFEAPWCCRGSWVSQRGGEQNAAGLGRCIQVFSISGLAAAIVEHRPKDSLVPHSGLITCWGGLSLPKFHSSAMLWCAYQAQTAHGLGVSQPAGHFRRQRNPK